MSNNNVLLSIRGAQKHFGGLQALSDVNLGIYEGEVYGLIGSNGAGKTTFFSAIIGLYMSNADEFVLGGTPYQPTAVHEVAKAGIARTFQNIHLFGDMTAAENVMVGRHIRTKASLISVVFRTKATHEEKQSTEDWVHDLLDYVGTDKYANYTARNLPYGHQHRLEIARALATQSKLLALDEPATDVNVAEKVELRGLLNKTRSGGRTILLIEHDMKLVTGLCGRLIVLDCGKVIAQGLLYEMQSSPAVIEAYFDVSAH